MLEYLKRNIFKNMKNYQRTKFFKIQLTKWQTELTKKETKLTK